ncbi:MAG: PepSY domain-containing protein, partial [Hyphomicrobium sp.]|nr:PepSY domain-containing protein [Hyphomicrobium sp.]
MTGEAGNASPSLTEIGLRWLSFLHRWLGVAACLLCVMWFVSGLVMMYVPYPAWTDADRLATLAPLDASRITVTPGKAFETANVPGRPIIFRLEMWGSEPVYRVGGFTKSVAISALDGHVIDTVSVDEAKS